MQTNQLSTIERQLKVKILLSGAVLLLLVGLHPVHVFADAGSSDTSDPTIATSTPADPGTPSTTTDDTTNTPASTSSTDTQRTITPTNTANNDSSTNNTNAPTSSNANDTASNQSDESTAATVTNQTITTTNSGNASSSGSSTGANATSGNAQAIATAINILSSSTDVQTNNINTYVNTITDNQNKDVVIDPITTGQPIDSQDTNKTEVNTASSGTIDNNLTIGAATGDATVSNNNVGGNATSGNATADANLINVISSNFTSGQYYVGVINILGNLSGNVLLNPDFVNQLLSDNPSVLSGDIAATNTVNQTISNVIAASAMSGNASVENNLLGGNARSGNATTSVNTFDLVNSNISGQDALLVFINVLGTWEGVIIGAPSGATTAVYGDSASNQVITGSNATSDQYHSTLASTTNEEINNVVDASAITGAASVAYNDQGGNATSGNAEVSVNLLNILNSDVSLSGWFGILFINVFGNWSGNFGIITPPSTPTTSPSGTATADINNDQSISLAGYIAKEAYTIFDQSPISNPAPGQILGVATNTNASSSNNGAPRITASVTHSVRAWWLPALAGFILAIASLSLEQLIQRTRKQDR